MILADKIIEERKRNGWSQEELAEKLSVSRQSVSKWESAQSVPDLNRILQMAGIFGVSTDYLLKDELGSRETVREAAEVFEESRMVSMEEASEFLDVTQRNVPWISLGVSLCILSIAPLMLLLSLSESKMLPISENMASEAGMIILLGLIALAVFMFISCGRKTERFEYLEKEKIETAYGVTGMVNERKSSQNSSVKTGAGVTLLILSALPIMGGVALNIKDSVMPAMVSLVLVMVATGVNLILRGSIMNEAYDKLLEKGEYTPEKKASAHIRGTVSLTFWMITIAVYLGWSLMSRRWNITWVVWPVAALINVAVSSITELISTRRH